MLDALKCIFLERNLATFQVPGEECTWTLVGRQCHIYKCTLVRHESKTTDKGETLGSCEDVSCEPETGSWHPVELPGRGIILGWDLDLDRIMGGQR